MIESLEPVTGLNIAHTLPVNAVLPLLMIQEDVTMAVAVQAPIVREVERSIGRVVMIKLVCAVLKLFSDSLNVSQPMTPVQVYETAQLWLDQYPTETLKDLILCLKRAKQGHYGKIYNRIDVAVIGEFFTQYLDEKAEFRENMHRQQKQSDKASDLEMIGSIEANLPGAFNRAMGLARSTDIPAEAPITHERYLSDLHAYLPGASEKELGELRNQAEGHKLTDIMDAIDKELTRRAHANQNIAIEPA